MAMTPEERLAWTRVCQFIVKLVTGEQWLAIQRQNIEDAARASFRYVVVNGGSVASAEEAAKNRAHTEVRRRREDRNG